MPLYLLTLNYLHRLAQRSPWRAIGLFLLLSGSCLAAGPKLEWIRQFGSWGGDSDSVAGLAPDGQGSVYISGNTLENGYLRKYDAMGNQGWSQQFDHRGISRVFVGATGTVSVVAQTTPGSALSFFDFDSAGIELSSRPAPTGRLAADNGGSMYAVRTLGPPTPDDDGLLTKFDAAGNQLWSRQFGTEDHEQSHLVSADSAGNVFTYSTTIDSDCYSGCRPRASLTKFDAEGNEYWTRYVESARYVNKGGVLGDGLGNVYITGNSNAPLAAPRLHLGYDNFVAKYDADGNRLWLQEFGTPDDDSSSGVALDNLGNVLVIGRTRGNLVNQDAGDDNPFNYDSYLALFDTHGNELGTSQFGTPEAETASHIVADSLGNVFIAGLTRGDLGGPNAGGGGYDVFIAKFSVVPEPSTAVLVGVIFSGLSMVRPLQREVRRRRSRAKGCAGLSPQQVGALSEKRRPTQPCLSRPEPN